MAYFSAKKDISAAVIGYRMGALHLDQMAEAGMTPAAVADLDEERCAGAKEKYPDIETYTDYTKMLADAKPGFVAVCTPHDTHTDIALDCLRAGAHVCCEKPLAITTEECETMLAEAKKQDRILTAYHNRHWDGGILKALRVIREEKLVGEPVRIEAAMSGHRPPSETWRGSRSKSGGVLYDWGVHLTEYALHVFDDEITEVVCVDHRGYWSDGSIWKDDANEDEATAMVRFRNGGVFVLRLSNIDCDPEPFAVKITCTDGVVSFTPHGNYRVAVRKGGDTYVSEGKNPDSEWWTFYRNVAAALVGEEDLVITGEYAMRPIHILDLAAKSAREGAAQKPRIP